MSAPSAGGSRRTDDGVVDISMGRPSIRSDPATVCSISSTISRATRLRAGQRLGDTVYGARRDPDPVEELDPLRPRPADDDPTHHLVDDVPVSNSLRVGGETGVFGPLWVPYLPRQHCELSVVADRQGQFTV